MSGAGPGTLTVLAPVSGRVVELADVPDEVFSGHLMGPGLAVEADGDVQDALAPVTGEVSTLWHHAAIVRPDDTAEGTGVLMHLGIDTVHLHEAAFTKLAAANDRVPAGRDLIRWDVAATRADGRAVHVPVVLISRADVEITPEVRAGDHVEAGAPLFRATLR